MQSGWMDAHVQNKNGKFARGPGGDLYIMYPNIGRITQFIDCTPLDQLYACH